MLLPFRRDCRKHNSNSKQNRGGEIRDTCSGNQRVRQCSAGPAWSGGWCGPPGLAEFPRWGCTGSRRHRGVAPANPRGLRRRSRPLQRWRSCCPRHCTSRCGVDDPSSSPSATYLPLIFSRAAGPYRGSRSGKSNQPHIVRRRWDEIP